MSIFGSLTQIVHVGESVIHGIITAEAGLPVSGTVKGVHLPPHVNGSIEWRFVPDTPDHVPPKP